MPFNDNLPADGTKPYGNTFRNIWANLRTFINGLETAIEGKAAATHPHVVADITDATPTGQSLMKSSSASAAAALLGADVALVNVKAYGAVGDGVANDTTAVQNAVNAVGTAKAIVYFPPGTYLIRAINMTGKSNITLMGIRGRSILKYRTTGAGGNDCMIQWNPSANPAQNDRNITIRDLTLQGTGVMVDEHQALLLLSAVDDVLVDNCEFLDMIGDGINIARTTVGGADSGVRNRRIKITNCLFDGNFIGRNGVTIIGGEDITIERNTFRRCAHSSMPGAIDIEPNSFDTSVVIRDVRIANNLFEENGGFEGDVHLAFIPAAPTTVFDRITIERNQFLTTRNATAIDLRWVNRASTAADPEQNLVIRHNYIGPPSASNTYNKHQAIKLAGVKGTHIYENTFVGWARRAVGMVGSGSAELVRTVTVKRNRFIDMGATTGYIVNLDYVLGLDVYENESVGATTLSAFVAVMAAYDVDAIRVVRNRTRNANNALHFGPTATPAQTSPLNNFSAQNEVLVGQVNVAGMATGVLPGGTWTGTQAEYDALATKSSMVTYQIT